MFVTFKNRCKGTYNFPNVQEKCEILEKIMHFFFIFFPTSVLISK